MSTSIFLSSSILKKMFFCHAGEQHYKNYMNTGRTTSFFGCFLVGILMSKNNYDKIDVFLGSFLLVSDEKARECIFFGFSMAVRLKNINFYILISVNILYQNNELSTSVKYIFYAIFTISCFFVINPCNSSIKCMFCIS